MHSIPPSRILHSFVLLVFFSTACLAISATNRTVPSFEPSDCFLENPEKWKNENVSYGYLTVPESRDRNDSKLLKIAVCTLHAKSEMPAEDPVFFLSGGPGGSGLAIFLDHFLNHYLREDRDIIVMDFRGIGYSEPVLYRNMAKDILLLYVHDLTPEEMIERSVELMLPCLDHMRAAGVDLGAYNSAAMAADIEDLRQALGIEQWNLYGISYGTRVAQAVMRDYPKGIRSVILDSPVPAGPVEGHGTVGDFAGSLEKLAKSYDAQMKSQGKNVDFIALYQRTLRALVKQPLTLSVPAEFNLGTDQSVINAQDFNIAVHQLL